MRHRQKRREREPPVCGHATFPPVPFGVLVSVELVRCNRGQGTFGVTQRCCTRRGQNESVLRGALLLHHGTHAYECHIVQYVCGEGGEAPRCGGALVEQLMPIREPENTTHASHTPNHQSRTCGADMVVVRRVPMLFVFVFGVWARKARYLSSIFAVLSFACGSAGDRYAWCGCDSPTAALRALGALRRGGYMCAAHACAAHVLCAASAPPYSVFVVLRLLYPPVLYILQEQSTRHRTTYSGHFETVATKPPKRPPPCPAGRRTSVVVRCVVCLAALGIVDRLQ